MINIIKQEEEPKVIYIAEYKHYIDNNGACWNKVEVSKEEFKREKGENNQSLINRALELIKAFQSKVEYDKDVKSDYIRVKKLIS